MKTKPHGTIHRPDRGLHHAARWPGRLWYFALLLLAAVPIGCDALFGDDDDRAAPVLQWYLPRPQAALQPPTPAIADGSAFVPMGSEIQRLDLETGQVQWRASLADVTEFNGELLTDANAVYAYERGRWLRAHALDDGRLLWHTPFENVRSRAFTQPLDDGAQIFVTLVDSVMVVRKSDGLARTLTRLPREASEGQTQGAHFAALDGEDGLCLPVIYNVPDGDRHGLVYHLDRNTGEIRWIRSLEPVEQNGVVFIQHPNACVDGGDVFGVVAGGRIVGFDKATGAVVWDFVPAWPEGFPIGPATSDGVRLYMGSAREKLYALDLSTGAVEWSTLTRGSFVDDLAVVRGEQVYINNGAFGEVWVMDRRSGRVQASFGPPSEYEDDFLSWIAVDEGYLVVLGFRNVYCYML